jgi:DNA invertase Pin-like site-specific DNA recombinase
MATSYAEQEGLRVLGAIRQSKTKTAKGKGGELLVKGVSLEEQKSKITKWSDAYGHHIVKLTEDASVSGKTSPFKRKGLGPYLSDPALLASWDVLTATKLDRIARSAEEFLALLRWANKNGKGIKILNLPDLDDNDPSGKLVLTILAAVAEMERAMASERRNDTLAELEAQGRWSGGAVPYGWRAVEREGKPGWYLEPDEGATADVLRTMANMSMEGKSNGQITKWLNDHHIPNSAGNVWSVERVRLVLHAKATAELLGYEDAGELAEALRSRAPAGRGERVGGSMLLRIAFCAHDGRPLYLQRKKKTRKHSNDYYRCIQCHQNVQGPWLEAEVERQLLDAVGGRELTRRRLVQGEDAREQVHLYVSQLRSLRAMPDQSLVQDAIAGTEDKLRELKAAQESPDRYVLEPTGVSVAEHWERLDHAERGSFLRAWHVTARADREAVDLDLGDLRH